MDVAIRDEGRWEAKKKPSIGLVHYRIPRELGRQYVAVGDPGMSNAERRSTLNVPVVGVFDITNFPNETVRLVELDIIDGEGKYEPWIRSFKDAMISYACQGFYDATNVQTAFEDENGSLRGWAVKGLQFNVSTKPWSITILKRLMESGMLAFPMIETLWYQARIYVAQGQQAKKNADDVMAMLLVFCLMILDQQALWIKLNNRLTLPSPEPKDDQHVTTDTSYTRYSRPGRSRYTYDRRAR